MSTVVVPYATEKTVIRCVLSKIPAQSLAGEARKRFINHEKWLQIKDYDLKLQQERKKQAEEQEKQERARLAEELKRKENESKQRVQQWFNEKLKESEKKKKQIIVASLPKERKVDNQIIEEWAKQKANQKKTEQKEEEERKKLEEEKIKRRRALSGLCYEQWAEKAKQKPIEIPRNGYQIFGPKPEPVVLDEWVTPQLPKMSSSVPAINNPKLYVVTSFRSESQIEASSNRSCISKLDLGCLKERSMTPWAQVTGGCHARGVTKRTPSLTWTDRTYYLKDIKKERKKQPHFRP